MKIKFVEKSGKISVGQHFYTDDVALLALVQTEDDEVGLISVQTGLKHSPVVEVRDITNITNAEFIEITCHFPSTSLRRVMIEEIRVSLD